VDCEPRTVNRELCPLPLAYSLQPLAFPLPNPTPIDGIVGARPNMMKMAPSARAIAKDGTLRRLMAVNLALRSHFGTARAPTGCASVSERCGDKTLSPAAGPGISGLRPWPPIAEHRPPASGPRIPHSPSTTAAPPTRSSVLSSS
jgi:hypothetical protein